MEQVNRLFLILLATAILLGACTAPEPTRVTPSPSPQPSPQPTQQPFRIIGYVTEGVFVDVISFEKLTHINYAFLIPNANGTFEPLANPWKLKQIVESAHAQGVQVLLSVGGWGWDSQFESLAASPEARGVFVNELLTLVQEYDLDGIDIDWEYPDPGESAQNFLALMRQIRLALPDKLLTIAAVALGETGEGVPSETFEILDFVNIMVYDGDPANHSSMQYASDALDYWLGRGLPAGKTVLGVPFYSRPDGIPYSKIVQADPQAANLDRFTYYGVELNYNGIPTIQAKTHLAMERASGIMIWALEHDFYPVGDATGDDLSLLSAIDRVVRGEE
ncbi:MAG: hypothetical protein JW726_15835 [Anaerolineales bacterium]|nr:hypothetical protein [Anaerolineales bacterium]